MEKVTVERPQHALKWLGRIYGSNNSTLFWSVTKRIESPIRLLARRGRSSNLHIRLFEAPTFERALRVHAIFWSEVVGLSAWMKWSWWLWPSSMQQFLEIWMSKGWPDEYSRIWWGRLVNWVHFTVEIDEYFFQFRGKLPPSRPRELTDELLKNKIAGPFNFAMLVWTKTRFLGYVIRSRQKTGNWLGSENETTRCLPGWASFFASG